MAAVLHERNFGHRKGTFAPYKSNFAPTAPASGSNHCLPLLFLQNLGGVGWLAGVCEAFDYDLEFDFSGKLEFDGKNKKSGES